ncbi:MAG: hypothetical protein HLUCCA13_05500 [Halomonas sp. HL-48]|nr:MAG: hypothetical protein HLUCCA13_05500 [Halomonas sp. HL-48]
MGRLEYSGKTIVVLRTVRALFTTDTCKQRIGVMLFCLTPSLFDMKRAFKDAVLRRYWHLRNQTNASTEA